MSLSKTTRQSPPLATLTIRRAPCNSAVTTRVVKKHLLLSRAACGSTTASGGPAVSTSVSTNARKYSDYQVYTNNSWGPFTAALLLERPRRASKYSYATKCHTSKLMIGSPKGRNNCSQTVFLETKVIIESEKYISGAPNGFRRHLGRSS